MTDILDHIATEPSIQAHMDRVSIRAAVVIASRESEDGTFSIADVRPHIVRNVRPATIGATMCAMVKQHDLEVVGFARSGNTAQRNGNRVVNLYRAVTS